MAKKKKTKKPKKVEEKKFKFKKNIRLNAVNPKHATKVRKDLLDVDYADKLDEYTYLWHVQFTDEYTAGAVQKTKTGKVKAGHLHNTPELAKKVYDANNWRNNDIYAVSKANGLLKPIDMTFDENNEEVENKQITNVNLTEMAIISKIDNENIESEDDQYLTKREFINLLKSGASIPEEMKEFYKKRYKLEF